MEQLVADYTTRIILTLRRVCVAWSSHTSVECTACLDIDPGFACVVTIEETLDRRLEPETPYSTYRQNQVLFPSYVFVVRPYAAAHTAAFRLETNSDDTVHRGATLYTDVDCGTS